MLEENKRLYEEVADVIIPEWRKLNKNDLIRKAVEVGPKSYLYDGYISAIMYKYWNKIDSYYYRCKFVTTPEDIHTWLASSVMYAIEHHAWDDPTKAIYNDPNGPDKVVNRSMECRRLTFYQQLNRYNRKINSDALSLDSLTDDYKDFVMPTENNSVEVEYHDMISRYFNSGEKIIAFILDAIMYEDIFGDDIEIKRLYSHLRKFDDIDTRIFSDRYGLEVNLVGEAMHELQSMSVNKFKKTVEYNLLRLNFKLGKEDI